MSKKEIQLNRLKAISLFSCIGVAEYYLKELGIDVVLASDIDAKRCDVHRFLYPESAVVCGDIRDDKTKGRLQLHRKKINAKYTIVVAPYYKPSVEDDIAGTDNVMITAASGKVA